jgi:hypothetical protein
MSNADTLSKDDTRAWLDVPTGYVSSSRVWACAFALWVERPDFPSPSKVRDAVEQAAARSRAHAVDHHVSPALLRLVLREQASEYGGAREWLAAMLERLGLGPL